MRNFKASLKKSVASLSVVAMTTASVFSGGIGTLATTYADGTNISSMGYDLDNMPEYFNLKDLGYVTPVKSQANFGSCWAFAAVAAVESTILTELNLTYDQYTEKYGEKLDLSERAVAYFAKSRISDEESTKTVFGSQYGEGSSIHEFAPVATTLTENLCFMYGGSVSSAISLFAQGSGLLTEEEVPYHGKDSVIYYYYSSKTKGVYKVNGVAYFDTTGDNAEILKEYPIVQKYQYDIAADDWTVDEDLRFKNVVSVLGTVELKSPAIVETVDGNNKYVGTDMDAVAAMKEELLNGHALVIAYAADTSLATELNKVGKYINLDNYAQYTYEPAPISHAVTVVGYDDNYSRYNFLDHTNDANGTGEALLPEGDGAWIIKNSWGAVTETFPNYLNWGTDGSGYFYLSYYDQSIVSPTSYALDMEHYGEDSKDYIVSQYDYMNGDGYQTIAADGELASANVFYAEEDQALTRVGITTAEFNTEVRTDVYVLNDGYSDPTDGTLVASVEDKFYNPGFKTIDIHPTYLKAGTYYSVVVNEKRTDENGSKDIISLAYGSSKDRAEKLWPILISRPTDTYYKYSVSVINPGESFVYYNNEWIDWSSEAADVVKNNVDGYPLTLVPDFSKVLKDRNDGVITSEEADKLLKSRNTADFKDYLTKIRLFTVDNFPIKTYSEKIEGTVNGISYKLDENGVLTVTGTGSIEKVTEKSSGARAPWYSYNYLINSIVISEGITDVVVAGDDYVNISNAFGQFTGWLKYGNDIYKLRFEDGTLVETVIDTDKVSDVFDDVLDGKWYSDEILYVFKRGAMTGKSVGVFDPFANLKRSEAIAMLYQLEGSPEVDTSLKVFSDVSSKNWYNNAAIWGKTNEIVTGYISGANAGKFGPNKNITRQDFMKIIYEFAKLKGCDISVDSATSYKKVEDSKLISKYARECMNWGYENGLIAKGDNFRPQDKITRCEAAAILARFLKAFDC